MDLKLFFDPVNENIIDEQLPNWSFQKSIYINSGIIHDIEDIDIAILGITDHRSMEGAKDNSTAPDIIRKQLYGLSKNGGKNRIRDLGNLRNGPEIEDTNLRLKEVVEYLMENEVIPIIIGGTQNFSLGHYLGYENLNKLVSLLNIDAKIDLEENGNDSSTFLNKIFKHDPNFLFNYIHLGHQSYLVNEHHIGMLERLFFESYRLGELKENIHSVEPIIREADMITFDVSAIQSQYCNEVYNPNVFGFTGEEACQLMWYAGLNDKLSSIGFYNYLPANDIEQDNTSVVISTMIWYFIEGYYNRKGERNFISNDYVIYEVAIGIEPDTIRFYKSKLSEKWWMEVPDQSSDSIFLRNKMVPCNYSDYEIAQKGEIPQRWINALAKMT